jgi:hypothetical protein
MDVERMIDRAMELKQIEADAAKERRELEEIIYDLNGPGKIPATHGQVFIQERTKDTWQPEICQQVARVVPLDEFYRLFKVSFSGQKREIDKVLAASDNQQLRDLLRSACVIEPARPAFKYELASKEAAA